MIFVDTSAIFALADELDIHHQEAKRLFDALLRTERRRVTHSYVLIESMALLQRRLGREQAMEFATVRRRSKSNGSASGCNAPPSRRSMVSPATSAWWIR